jgi:acetylornithine/N-succinyldiaminopimelate aminotransferase
MTGVALAVTRALSQPSFLESVRRVGSLLGATLSDLAVEFGGAHARGQGLLWALVFDRPIAARITEAARQGGLLINAARPNVLRFMPQLGVSAQEIRVMATRLRAAYADAAD